MCIEYKIEYWIAAADADVAQMSCHVLKLCDELWIHNNTQLNLNSFSPQHLITRILSFTVQGSHRDSTKQNKDLATLTQPHSSSNNLNNPSGLSSSKNAAAVATDADVNRNGPYFDVAASKNVRISIHFHSNENFLFCCQLSSLALSESFLFSLETTYKINNINI